MRNAIIAALLLSAGAAFADNTAGSPAPTQATPKPEAVKLTQDIRKDREQIQEDRKELRAAAQGERTKVKDLNDQEKTAIVAVRADKSLTADQRRDQIRKIHADFKGKRDALRDAARAERKAKHEDIRKERTDMQKDMKERREVRHGGK